MAGLVVGKLCRASTFVVDWAIVLGGERDGVARDTLLVSRICLAKKVLY